MRDNSQRAKMAIILIALVGVLDVAMGVASYMELNLLKQMLLDIAIPDAQIDTNDMRIMIIGFLYTGVFIVSVVTFIRWFRRAYYNLHLKAEGVLSYSEGWAAGAWFIPFLNLFRPLYIMKELYAVTHLILTKNLSTYQGKGSTFWVSIWWLVWVVSNIFDNALFRAELRADTIEDLIASSQMSIISAIISLPLCLLAIKVIRDYSKIEVQFYQLFKDENMIQNLPKRDIEFVE